MSEAPPATSPEHGHGVCPSAHAGWLTTPIRKFIHDPQRMLAGLVKPGNTALDLGCGPGYFTLPMARMVGPEGHVIAVDLQPEMLRRLQARAQRAGLMERIVPAQCTAETIGDLGPADFALAFYMVHEVPDEERFLAEVRGSLKDGGHLLLVEPKGHVSTAGFSRTVDIAHAAGLRNISAPRVSFSRAALFAAD
jgi:ubiquinone/menaquinone biosynthesis C-methylase UbiE